MHPPMHSLGPFIYNFKFGFCKVNGHGDAAIIFIWANLLEYVELLIPQSGHCVEDETFSSAIPAADDYDRLIFQTGEGSMRQTFEVSNGRIGNTHKHSPGIP